MTSKRTPYQTAADIEIDRLQRENERLRAERDDWRAAHTERFAELQAVCIDRDAQVDEVVRLRDVAWKHGNRADEAETNLENAQHVIEQLRGELDRLKADDVHPNTAALRDLPF